jgi:hypothetical protein
LLTGAAWAADEDSEIAYAIQTLRQAGVATDGPGLLDYFRKRTLSEDDRAKLAGVVRRLGDPKYRVRCKADQDLRAAGRVALPFVRAALEDPDLEIARRAERLLRHIEGGSEAVQVAAAAQVLAARKPDGATAVLLAYLPTADEEVVQEALLAALAAVGIKDGKADPALVRALADKEPARRAAAAFAVGRLKDQRPSVRPLLQDSDARVRFQAASALAQAGDKAAVDTLIAHVGDGPRELAWQAEDLLCRLAGDKAPAVLGDADGADRRKCRQAWETWWKASADQMDVARLIAGEPIRGLTLIAETDGVGEGSRGRISEISMNGKVRWEINSGLGGPVDLQVLPGRRLLVGEYIVSRVTERDRRGNVLWQKQCTSSVISCTRLASGNTFIATTVELFEVNREGKTVFSWRKPTIYFATKLRNGHILYGDNNSQVYELDAKGKQLWTINLPGAAWGSIEKLPGGRYLVCLYGGGKVVEVDAAGKVHWEVQVQNPTLATRLRNGHTLVGANRMVAEYDRAGKEVWKQTTTGRVWRVRRY